MHRYFDTFFICHVFVMHAGAIACYVYEYVCWITLTLELIACVVARLTNALLPDGASPSLVADQEVAAGRPMKTADTGTPMNWRKSEPTSHAILKEMRRNFFVAPRVRERYLTPFYFLMFCRKRTPCHTYSVGRISSFSSDIRVRAAFCFCLFSVWFSGTEALLRYFVLCFFFVYVAVLTRVGLFFFWHILQTKPFCHCRTYY